MTIDLKRILTEEGWTDAAPDCKGKDKELLKTLREYKALGEKGDFDLRCKTLGKLAALATTLKSANEIKADADAVKYLNAMVGATKVKQAEIIKARAEAQKVEAIAQKQAAAEVKVGQDGRRKEDEDEQEADSFLKLRNCLKSLKSAREPYFYLYCKDKPYGLVISRKNIWQDSNAKKELCTMAGGSTTPPKRGWCRREGDKALVFDPDDGNPSPGMASIVQKWIKANTSLAFKVIVGGETAEDEGQPMVADAKGAPAAGQPAARPEPARPELARIPAAWEEMRQTMTASINELKQAIRKEFAGEGRGLIAEIEKNVQQLDRVFGARDRRLIASLAKAQAATDAAARNAELKNCKALLADYINYVKSEPLIAHIDNNPFGVKTGLRQNLTGIMTRTAQAIG